MVTTKGSWYTIDIYSSSLMTLGLKVHLLEMEQLGPYTLIYWKGNTNSCSQSHITMVAKHLPSQSHMWSDLRANGN